MTLQDFYNQTQHLPLTSPILVECDGDMEKVNEVLVISDCVCLFHNSCDLGNPSRGDWEEVVKNTMKG